MGIFEILRMTDKIRTMLIKGTSATDLRAAAIEDGMTTLLKDGMLKVKANYTTLPKYLRNAFTME